MLPIPALIAAVAASTAATRLFLLQLLHPHLFVLLLVPYDLGLQATPWDACKEGVALDLVHARAAEPLLRVEH